MLHNEFGVSCSTNYNYGRSKFGSSARKRVRSVRSKNFFSAAIMKSGIIYHEWLHYAYNGEYYTRFLRFYGKNRDPFYAKLYITMYSCSMHNTTGINELINPNGDQLLLLIPHCPHINAIEEFSAKWKGYIKTRNSNTTQELENSIFTRCSTMSVEDCNGFLWVWNDIL